MSNSSAQSSSAQSSYLLSWINRTVSQSEMRVGYRLRGNTLHLLYEADPCPNQQAVIQNVLNLLETTDVATLLPDSERIYQIWLYGRKPQAASSHESFSKKLAWTFRINLDQLDELGQQFHTDGATTSEAVSTDHLSGDQAKGDRPQRPATASSSATSTASGSFSEASTDLDPVARRLSETLNRLGVSVKVAAKTQSNLGPNRPTTTSSGVASVSFPRLLDTANQRLWIACRARYSPSPSLIAEPIARQLRSFNLEGFRDAVVSVRVAGEDKPDWSLRIDLTPADTLMRAWARWGDVAALSRLLEQTLNHQGVTLKAATLKEATLHLVCQQENSLAEIAAISAPSREDESKLVGESSTAYISLPSEVAAPVTETPVTETSGTEIPGTEAPTPETSNTESSESASESNSSESETASENSISLPQPTTPSWDSAPVKQAIQSLLDDLAPQGIHAAVLYGQQPHAVEPDWVEWLTLPASSDPHRSTAALELAQSGDLEAIAFLISRLLNPDLDTQVATGGVRIQVLPKDELLHVMCDAPACPPQDPICGKVVRLLQQLKVPHISGVRLYGRRSGLRSPLWSYGTDFVARQRFVPEPEPEFAATSAYVSELVTHQDESPLRSDLTADELKARWLNWNRRLGQTLQRSLLKTQLVTPTADAPLLAIPQTLNRQGMKTAVIWATVGLLSVVQIDWIMGVVAEAAAEAESRQNELVEPPPALAPRITPNPDPSEATADGSVELGETDSPAESPIPSEAATTSDAVSEADDPFTANDFIQSASDLGPSPEAASDPSVLSISQVEADNSTDIIQEALIDESPYPSFNSRQLDLKLALYHQRVAEEGVPDVLVIGSSRALRGVDPVVLEQSLAELGYSDADVFNFGINGATAQVVELVVQRIFVPQQLPKMIVWADGARAFNGGREDITYNGIASSEGYDLLAQGQLSVPIATPEGLIDASPSSADSQPSSLTAAFSTSLRESYQSLDEWLSDRLAHVSLAHDQRDRLKSILQDTLTADWPHSPTTAQPRADNTAAKPGAAGADAEGDPLDGDRILGQIDRDGFLPLDVRFDPVTYYDKFARVPGNYDKDYANFRLSGAQATALESIVSLSQEHGVPVVFVNLPLTEEYLDPYRTAHEAEFRQFMLEVDLANDSFIFRDLSSLWLDQDDYYGYFSDPSHLNRYGAFEVSKRLAQDAMIPWFGSGSEL